MIKLIVGLGNPGMEYQSTRHNVGFWCIEALAQKLKLNFTIDSKYFGEVAKTRINNEDLFLLKPQTYMNLSGKSIQALVGFYKILPNQVLVIHDELDFMAGVVKLKCGGGNGGHNGLKDIDRVIGRDYWRLIGIGHPGDSSKVSNYVLNRPSSEDSIEIERSMDKVLSISDKLIAADFANVQKILHTK